MLQQDDFLSLSKMNFGLSEEQSLVLDKVDRVCKSIRPVEDKCYLQHRFNDRVGPAFGQAHLRGLPISKSFADLVIIFAYTRGKREGMCAFLVERGSAGFSAKPIENKMGLPTSDTGTIYLEKCEVPKENMLGPRGKGLSVAYSALMSGRLSVAAGCVGVMQDCLDEAVRYSGVRIQHGKPIGKHQLVQRHIGIISTNMEAARWLVLRAAYLKEKYEENPKNGQSRDAADLEIAKAKYFAANASFDAANRAVQVFGANGYSLENRPARHLMDTRVTKIYEGTDEILEQKIALGVLGKAFEAYS